MKNKKRTSGFTLIELLVVIAIIAIIASIAIPNLLSARLNANESAAIATLKNISSAQAQCQASGIIDANNNGAGEYGYFAELAGGTAVRNDESAMGLENSLSPRGGSESRDKHRGLKHSTKILTRYRQRQYRVPK